MHFLFASFIFHTQRHFAAGPLAAVAVARFQQSKNFAASFLANAYHTMLIVRQRRGQRRRRYSYFYRQKWVRVTETITSF